MTNEKAMNLLDNLKGMIDESQGNDYDSAFNLAIKAFEKQIPKKVIETSRVTRSLQGIKHKCPSCGMLLLNESLEPFHCSSCGQSLDWE